MLRTEREILKNAADEHAAFLTPAAQTNNIANFAQLIPLIGIGVEDEIVECFRRGGGVPYSSYKRFPEVMRELSAPTFDFLLVDKILPLVSGLVDSLPGERHRRPGGRLRERPSEREHEST